MQRFSKQVLEQRKSTTVQNPESPWSSLLFSPRCDGHEPTELLATRRMVHMCALSVEESPCWRLCQSVHWPHNWNEFWSGEPKEHVTRCECNRCIIHSGLSSSSCHKMHNVTIIIIIIVYQEPYVVSQSTAASSASCKRSRLPSNLIMNKSWRCVTLYFSTVTHSLLVKPHFLWHALQRP